MIGGACSCKEIEQMLSEFLNEARSIVGGSGKKSSGKKRAPSERTPRQEFMSQCMTSPKKGGQGKGMAICAAEWKQK